MPIPIAAIAAAAPIIGGALNSASTAGANRNQARFSHMMYEKQKTDNLEFWRMQNEYNSPQAQMRRFQEAGLNPNLIYGQGNSGNASPVPTPDVQGVQYRSPEWGRGISDAPLAFMNAMYDLEIKQAQIDNLKTQNGVLQEDILTKRVDRQRSEFDLGFETELRDVSADARREGVRQRQVSTDLAIKEDVRRELSNASSLQEAAERILNLRSTRNQMSYETARIQQNIKLMKQDGILKDLEIELRKIGLNPNSPYWATMLGRIFSSETPGKFLDYLRGSAAPQNTDFFQSLIFGSGFKASLKKR